MRRVDDDLDEMDVQLDKAQSQVNELGMGLVKGLAKDASNASRPKIFGRKKAKEEKASAERAIAEQERRDREAREARYAEERAAQSSGSSHMLKAAETSKFGSRGVRTYRRSRLAVLCEVTDAAVHVAGPEEMEPTRL